MFYFVNYRILLNSTHLESRSFVGREQIKVLAGGGGCDRCNPSECTEITLFAIISLFHYS